MGQTTSRPAPGNPRLIAIPGPLPPGEPKPWPTYDYIIVGGGTAGCVLAARLSEDRRTTVLLIEAGKDFYDALPTKIPFSFSNIFRTDLDWDTDTIPQRELNNRETYWPRGKVLGGTSSTNALIYHRCSPSDFDEWVALGAEGWSYNDLNPHFMNGEKFRPSWKEPMVNPADHGASGPRKTGFPSETAPINECVIEACQELGMQNIDDINAGRGSLGVTRLIGTLDSDGRRSSTATAYLTNEVLNRPNLTYVTDTMIQKLVFSDVVASPKQPPRVIGVEMNTSQDPQIYCCGANKEVIVCAGTVGTPQLLMLSGVGPAEDLQKLDIPVVKNMPAVGQNVIDHVSSGPIRFRTKPGLTYDFLSNSFWGLLASLRWRLCGTGPLSSMVYSSAAFVRSTDPRLPYSGSGPDAPIVDHSSGPDAPDLELVWAPQAVFADGVDAPSPSTDGVTFAAIALKPESRGRITLKSNDAFDPPNIDPQYLSTENDMNVLVRGVRLILKLAHTGPVASKLHLEPRGINTSSPWWPGVADPNEITDDEIREMVRRTAQSAWHPVSSARMGGSPQDSVVDPSLRVHGIAGLRCVDASVFPTQVSGHPCAVVVAMAEKAADMIKASAASHM
ncbi:GMC oxidoreductase [Ganoderma leucocontextum]|nr:GMC oxidoreductase [Ganoderma leucocontextum]